MQTHTPTGSTEFVYKETNFASAEACVWFELHCVMCMHCVHTRTQTHRYAIKALKFFANVILNN